jgi:carbamoyl-phosphate synthase large subunit
MTRRILLPGAGTGAGNNLIRSLRDDYPGLVVVGVHDDRFTLRNSKANRNYLVPRAGDARFIDAVRTIIERERVDLLVPNTAHDVAVVSELRDVLPCRTFLPSKSVIERCQDDQDLQGFLRAHGVPAATTTKLPGRDFACQSLWKDGRPVLIKTVERLAYLAGEAGAAGAIESLAKTVNEPCAVAVCIEAILALDPNATGAFSVDLKEGRVGVPCVTRVHAGRFTTMLNFFDLTGRHNMSSTYVRLALDEPVLIGDLYDVAEDRYFVRGIDTLPAIFRGDQLAEGIEEVA